MRRAPNRDRAKEKFWRSAISRQIASGLSAAKFCQGEGLNPNTLSTWKQLIKERDEENLNAQRAAKAEARTGLLQSNFVPIVVPIEPKSQEKQSQLLAELQPDGTLLIFAGVDLQTLAVLIKAARETLR